MDLEYDHVAIVDPLLGRRADCRPVWLLRHSRHVGLDRQNLVLCFPGPGRGEPARRERDEADRGIGGNATG
jgi:hypothetical protein